MLRRSRFMLLALVLLLSTVPAAFGQSAPETCGDATVSAIAYSGATRIAGLNRYDTAAKAADEAFALGTDTVVIATGTNWPDALCAAPLAVAHDAPLLLVKPTSLPAEVKAVINKMGATKAIILGGTAAVSLAVETQLKDQTTVTSVTRIAGANRYDTAEQIAEAVIALQGMPASGQLFVATGENFPDALAAAPIAGAQGMPIMLTRKTSLSGDVISFLQAHSFEGAFVVGGTGVVSDAVQTQLTSYVSTTPERVAGADRYDTAKNMWELGSDMFGTDVARPSVAYGRNFPDALAAGVFAGLDNQALVLCESTRLPTPSARAFCEFRDGVEGVYVFGGTAVIDPDVEDYVLTVVDPAREIAGRVPARVLVYTATDPLAGSDFTVYAEVLDQYGLPLPSAGITFSWFMPVTDINDPQTTDLDGWAESTQHLGSSMGGDYFSLEIVASRNGGMASASPHFQAQ